MRLSTSLAVMFYALLSLQQVAGGPVCKRSELSRRGSCFSSANAIANDLANGPTHPAGYGTPAQPARRPPRRQPTGANAIANQLASGSTHPAGYSTPGQPARRPPKRQPTGANAIAGQLTGPVHTYPPSGRRHRREVVPVEY